MKIMLTYSKSALNSASIDTTHSLLFLRIVCFYGTTQFVCLHLRLRPIADASFEVLDHPPNSPDLGPSDYFCPPVTFGSDDDLMDAVSDLSDSAPERKIFFSMVSKCFSIVYKSALKFRETTSKNKKCCRILQFLFLLQ